MSVTVPGSDHPAYATLTPKERYLWERQFRQLTESEIAEARSSTIEDRFEQVAILNSIARQLEYHEYTQEEIETVRQRWIRLKNIYAERERTRS